MQNIGLGLMTQISRIRLFHIEHGARLLQYHFELIQLRVTIPMLARFSTPIDAISAFTGLKNYAYILTIQFILFRYNAVIAFFPGTQKQCIFIYHLGINDNIYCLILLLIDISTTLLY